MLPQLVRVLPPIVGGQFDAEQFIRRAASTTMTGAASSAVSIEALQVDQASCQLPMARLLQKRKCHSDLTRMALHLSDASLQAINGQTQSMTKRPYILGQQLRRPQLFAEIPEGTTVTISPGPFGGVETPMAHVDGTIFVPVVNLAADYSSTDFVGFVGTWESGTGELAALDAATGDVLWKHDFPSMVLGGATVVNDLVFTATYEGMIYELDRGTGAEVWSHQADGRIIFLPAVAGDRLVIPVGIQDGGAPPHLLTLVIPEPDTTTLAGIVVLFGGLRLLRGGLCVNDERRWCYLSCRLRQYWPPRHRYRHGNMPQASESSVG